MVGAPRGRSGRLTDTTAEYLTVAQVARITGYAQKTVIRALRTGRLRGTKPASTWRTTRAAVTEWMEGDLK